MDGAQTWANFSGGGLREAGDNEVDGFLVGRRVYALKLNPIPPFSAHNVQRDSDFV